MGSQKVRTGRIVRYQNHPQPRAVADDHLENLTIEPYGMHVLGEDCQWEWKGVYITFAFDG